MNALKESGFLPAISRAIEEDEYRIARSQVARKGIDLEGISIEGISIGGQETCVIIPEFKCTFDIGRCPSRAIHQNFVFITHAHLDHIVSSISLSLNVTVQNFNLKKIMNLDFYLFDEMLSSLSCF